MTRHVRLRPLRFDDEAVFLEAQKAMEPDGFSFGIGYREGLAWQVYLDELEALRTSSEERHGLVPSVFLLATVDGQIVGRSSIRFMLNDYLASEGGHIGYCVLPGSRRRGYATDILETSVVIARAAGVERVLVTCDETNLASIAVIERCDGQFESTVPSTEGGPPKRRYWIT